MPVNINIDTFFFVSFVDLLPVYLDSGHFNLRVRGNSLFLGELPNFKLISKLCFFDKFLEKAVTQQMQLCLNANTMSDPYHLVFQT